MHEAVARCARWLQAGHVRTFAARFGNVAANAVEACSPAAVNTCQPPVAERGIVSSVQRTASASVVTCLIGSRFRADQEQCTASRAVGRSRAGSRPVACPCPRWSGRTAGRRPSQVAARRLRICNNAVRISYDPDKRERTLVERGLDFEDAVSVFEGITVEVEDSRRDHGERRIICYGLLAGRSVVVGYTTRGAARHIFSMRKANDSEQSRLAP